MRGKGWTREGKGQERKTKFSLAENRKWVRVKKKSPGRGVREATGAKRAEWSSRPSGSNFLGAAILFRETVGWREKGQMEEEGEERHLLFRSE